MGCIAIDLGSTNIKVAVYSDELQIEAWQSNPVQYIRDGSRVEFDIIDYGNTVIKMIANLMNNSSIDTKNICQLVFTGQAESLVVLGKDFKPIMNAISWMDDRSTEECNQIMRLFSPEDCFRKTGQMAVLPTWPATKILWIKNNLPVIFEKAAQYVMLKDYIVFLMTGHLVADSSIATFTFYFDIYNKCYWKEMMKVCGIQTSQLPPLVEPCQSIGTILPTIADSTGLTTQTTVNIGTLDHFAGMVGTGNIEEGVITLSTGTVMALATLIHNPSTSGNKMAVHYGFFPDTYVYLPVSESGGVCLDWFKNNFAENHTFVELDQKFDKKKHPSEILFLPYIVGTNAPEFDTDTCGIFYGIRAKHDMIDFAYAVMEGVAFLLAKNVNDIRREGIEIKKIIATGGGAKSDIWCQLYSDITGVLVETPSEKESACLGAAIINAVTEGIFKNYTDAVKQTVKISKRFQPRTDVDFKRKQIQFDYLYKAMLELRNI